VRAAALLRFGLLAAALGALEILCRTRMLTPFTMVAPSQFAVGLWNLIKGGRMDREIGMSLLCVAVAAFGAIVCGFGLAVLLHRWVRLRRALDPYIAGYYSLPIFVFYPVFIVLFGLNYGPIIVIGFLNAVVMMMMNMLNGLDRIPRVLLKTAAVFKLSESVRIREIVLPSVFPYFLTGTKFAFAYAFVGIIGSEFILASQGLGYEISFSFNNFDNTTMYALILFVILIVVAINAALFGWERAVLRRRGLG
jgi:NitT/TauT family transport system permease protein